MIHWQVTILARTTVTTDFKLVTCSIDACRCPQRSSGHRIQLSPYIKTFRTEYQLQFFDLTVKVKDFEALGTKDGLSCFPRPILFPSRRRSRLLSIVGMNEIAAQNTN